MLSKRLIVIEPPLFGFAAASIEALAFKVAIIPALAMEIFVVPELENKVWLH